MTSKRTRQRRLQVVEAAVEIIGEKGLADTRVADVAERAGLSSGLLLYYFNSKDELLMAGLTHAEDRFYLRVFHELSTLRDAPERLVRLIDLSAPEHVEGEPMADWKLWPEMWVRAMRHEHAEAQRQALDRRWRTTIADIVREGQQGGHFDRTCDPEDFAAQLAALIDGLALQVILKDPSITSVKMRQLCIDIAARQLGFTPPSTGFPVAEGDDEATPDTSGHERTRELSE